MIDQATLPQPANAPMNLTLGPILTYWPRERVLAFYEEISRSPVSRVYLGETTCSRRHELRLQDWLDLAARLMQAGKEVVLSTQVLIESESDLKTLRKLVEQEQFLVELNDFGALNLLLNSGTQKSFIAGYTLNIFNADTLSMLMGLGARRWVMPPEMTRAQLTALLASLPGPIETEVFAFGRMALAYSARCFTARHYNLQKDDCQFKCLDFADGLALNTREGQPFLVLNGIQTQSAKVYSLLADLSSLKAAGVSSLRISPQFEHTAQIIEIFDAALQQTLSPVQAQAKLEPLMVDKPCNGFWHGKAGVEVWVENPG